MDSVGIWLERLIFLAGNSPFEAMWFIFFSGGWIVVPILAWVMVKTIWLYSKQTAYDAKKDWILLAIDVPRLHEQTPRAVENIFAHLAGAHSPASWTEKWFEGKTQDTISMEIVSIDGHVQFLVRTTRGFRDLIEASIYAQYPDAEIVEVEDYTLRVPSLYPDREWEMFGTEMIPVKSDVFPLRTYPEFEDKVSGELKDPMAVMLENLSRIGPGEQVWFQIVMTPIEQKEFQVKVETFVKKLTGQKVEVKESLLEKAVNLPIKGMGLVLETSGILGTPSVPPKKEMQPFSKILQMSPGERKVLEAIEVKASKIVYTCKIRFLYVAKKGVFKKQKTVSPFVGAIKQLNTNDLQSLKPETKRVGMNATLWFFKESRNRERKRRFMSAYRSRSNWVGMPGYTLNIEELATLWHFPISMQSRPPQLKKTESKRSEPPINLPFAPS
ncbi:hypothetical protein KJ781_01670 [Patescibacteria group bacterium]|nr:hypothetical protein [Patescibacteria group bacterium]MBU1448991.1 hypothetical protein [Patescibacteria group bacterium]MBU2613464.1 hypothetical protein [Patescibacteria group bacterium]